MCPLISCPCRIFLSFSISGERTGAAENAGDLDELDGNPLRICQHLCCFEKSSMTALWQHSLGRVHFGGSGLCGRCRDGRWASGVVEVRVFVNWALAILNFETHTISSKPRCTGQAKWAAERQDLREHLRQRSRADSDKIDSSCSRLPVG